MDSNGVVCQGIKTQEVFMLFPNGAIVRQRSRVWGLEGGFNNASFGFETRKQVHPEAEGEAIRRRIGSIGVVKLGFGESKQDQSGTAGVLRSEQASSFQDAAAKKKPIQSPLSSTNRSTTAKRRALR